MIEQDYILKMVQEFFEALGKAVGQRGDSDGNDAALQARYDEIYLTFFRRHPNYFYTLDEDDMEEDLEAQCRSERDTFAKAQMLAELLYHDALLKKDTLQRCDLLRKSLRLFQYLTHGTKTYSWDREIKMNDIRRLLDEYGSG